MVDAREEITLDAFGSEGSKTELRRRLCEIIQARVEEILEMVSAEVKRAVHDDVISAGIVLTGGTAKLSGIDMLAEQVTGWPARVGMPRNLHGLTDALIDPAYATSVGLLQWTVNEAEASTWHRPSRASLESRSSRASAISTRTCSSISTPLLIATIGSPRPAQVRRK